MKLTYKDIINDMPRGWVRGKDQPIWHRKVYDMWRDTWGRVTDINNWRYEYYKDCKILEDYQFLSNYVKFVMSEPRFEEFTKTCDKVRWSVDKDKKDPNNRNYYPEYMTLTTQSENSKERNNRKDLPNPKVPVIGIKVDSIILLKSTKDGEAKGFDQSAISLCIRKLHKTHKGYRWYRINYKHNKTYRIKEVIV